jgi:hypothetical protein
MTATAALEAIAANHWYPRVRDGARAALQAIGSSGRAEPRLGRHAFAMRFFRHYECCSETPADLTTPPLRHGPDELNGDELRARSYPAQVEGYGAHGRVVRRIKRVPTAGLRMDGSFVVGADGGEFGGELVWLHGRSRPVRLLSENVKALHRVGSTVVAVTGLAHMSIAEGMLYRVQPDAGGQLAAVPWKRLPGAPRRSGLLDDGSLFVDCTDGAVVVRSDGAMHRFP